MDDSEEKGTTFKLKFPANRDFIVGDIDNIEQRTCLYIGQCVEILCFAINNDASATEATLQKWSKHICSLQAFSTASGYLGEGVDIRDSEGATEKIGQGCVNHERSCRPFTAGISEEIKVGYWSRIKLFELEHCNFYWQGIMWDELLLLCGVELTWVYMI